VAVQTTNSHQVGLVVDALVGEQEIVIKPLGQFLGEVAGVSGATILGDGSVALIVDVATLIAQAIQG
jgi:two-component system chemotaxis sensor kinase CheA